MKKLYLPILFTLTAIAACAQTAEDSVKAAVNNLFIAMKSADSAGVIKAFTAGGMLQSVAEKNGAVTVAEDKLTEFAHVIGGLKSGDADERITFNTIKVDGPLAIVWTPYQFYYKGVFSHCGVDSYQLVRINGEWKIQYIIDTRRKGACVQ